MSEISKSKVHFIGVGGIGMSGIAELLVNMGATVSGSDLSENAQTENLKKLGATIYLGHRKENLQDVDVVVYSSAIRSSNAEFQEAVLKKIPLIGRAEALAEIMHLKRGVAVAGTHGKTTTTSLTSQVFFGAGYDPTIVVGGRLDLIKSNAKLGAGDWLIAEADESDGSFLRLSPTVSIITNIDSDHLDYYKTEQNLFEAFRQFANRIPFYGAVIACGDDALLKSILSDFQKPVWFYGFGSENDFVVSGCNGTYELENRETTERVSFTAPLPGKHNALNCAAALLAGYKAGISLKEGAKNIGAFEGVDRRFQFKGEVGGVFYYDDYGHHPTEVRAVLQAMRERYPQQSVNVIFQPHRFSRTKDCWAEFTTCFEECDQLYLLDIYPAGERPIEAVNSQVLAEQVQCKKVTYIPGESIGQMVEGLLDKKTWQAGDIVLTLGAGSVSRMGEKLIATQIK